MTALPDMESAISDIERQMAHLAKLKEAYALVNAHRSELAAKMDTNPKQAEPDDLFASSGQVAAQDVAISPPTDAVHSYSSKSDAVRAAIAAMGREYTAADLEAWLANTASPINRQDVSFVLSRLAKSKEIKVKSQGSGARLSVYAKTGVAGGVARIGNSKPPAVESKINRSGTIRELITWFQEHGKGTLWEITKGTDLPISDVELALTASPDLFRCDGNIWQLLT